jgi:NAD(P)-dependent dehydrogenase (short-subunit alcohol dehydrogenase family)
MVSRGGGTIVNTASVGGLRGARAGAAYTASKFGLVGLTMNIAATFAKRGIRCNAIAPGSIATGMGADLEYHADAQLLVKADTHHPPPIPPEKMAAAAMFLASDGAAHVNGVILPVDDAWIAY